MLSNDAPRKDLKPYIALAHPFFFSIQASQTEASCREVGFNYQEQCVRLTDPQCVDLKLCKTTVSFFDPQCPIYDCQQVTTEVSSTTAHPTTTVIASTSAPYIGITDVRWSFVYFLCCCCQCPSRSTITNDFSNHFYGPLFLRGARTLSVKRINNYLTVKLILILYNLGSQ